jgi:hypothetical protein
MEVSGQIHAPAALPRVKSRQYPLDRRQSGYQSRSGRSGEEEKSLFLSVMEPRSSSQ